MTAVPLVRPDGTLLPVWGFLAFHEALRRDAARFRAAVDALTHDGDAPVAGGSPRIAGLRDHWRHYRQLVEFHHENEDSFLFPMLREAAPRLAPIIDELDAEHVALHSLLGRVTDVADRLPDHRAAGEAATCFDELAALLDRHLDAEEEHLVPVFLAKVAAQADPGDGPPGPGSPPGATEAEDGVDMDLGSTPLSFGMPWVLDGLDDHVLDLARATLPERRRRELPAWRSAYEDSLARWVVPSVGTTVGSPRGDGAAPGHL